MDKVSRNKYYDKEKKILLISILLTLSFAGIVGLFFYVSAEQSASSWLLTSLLGINALLFICVLLLSYRMNRRIYHDRERDVEDARYQVDLAVSSGRISVWSLDITTKRFNMVVGSVIGSKINTLADVYKLAHNDDIPILEKLWKDLFNSPSHVQTARFRLYNIVSDDYEYYSIQFKKVEVSLYAPAHLVGIIKNISKEQLSNENVEMFRKKAEYITTASGIVIMQFNVKNRRFIRWNSNGTQYRTFSIDEYFTRIHPDDMPLAQKIIVDMCKGELNRISVEYRYRWPGRDEYTWMDNSVYAYEYSENGAITSYLGICRNNTRWHDVQKRLEGYRMKTAFVTKINGVMFMQYIPDKGYFIRLNESGDGQESIITKEEFWSNIHPDDRQVGEGLFQKMDNRLDEKLSLEYRYRNLGSSRYDWYAIDVTSYDRNEVSQITSYLCLCRLNNNWKESMIEMEKLRNDAVVSNKMKSEFIANMSHEIRTPLNALVGFTALINNRISDEEYASYKAIIDDNSQRLLGLINDILDLSEIEAGNTQPIYSLFDVGQLLVQVAEPQKKRIHEGVDFICRQHEERMILSDFKRVCQVVTVLISNAAKFTEKGHIIIDYEFDKEGVRISVTDTGIGVAANMQQRIFDRFEKINTFIPGTGLGLSICKAITEMLGGKIGLDSEPGQGSTFWAWIPDKSEYNNNG